MAHTKLSTYANEILFPMLKAWGVDTLVVMGAWTDDCIAATCFDAVDKYGLDCVLISDGVATATVHGGKMIECLASRSGALHCDGDIDFL